MFHLLQNDWTQWSFPCATPPTLFAINEPISSDLLKCNVITRITFLKYCSQSHQVYVQETQGLAVLVIDFVLRHHMPSAPRFTGFWTRTKISFLSFCYLCPLSTGGNTIERWFTEEMISFRKVRKLLLDNTYGKQPSRTLKIIKARWCIRRNVWDKQINLTVFKRTVSKLSLLALICRSLSAYVCVVAGSSAFMCASEEERECATKNW